MTNPCETVAIWVGRKRARSSAHWGDENSILWGSALENIWNIFRKKRIGKLGVMFSSRSRLAPELENGRGKYNFQATKSQTVAGQDSGMSPVRTGAPCQPTGGTAGTRWPWWWGHPAEHRAGGTGSCVPGVLGDAPCHQPRVSHSGHSYFIPFSRLMMQERCRLINNVGWCKAALKLNEFPPGLGEWS